MAMTATELAEQVRDSNHRLTEAIKELRNGFVDLRGELAESRKELRQEMGELRLELRHEIGGLRKEFADLLVDVTEKFGAVSTVLENLRTRVEHSLSIAKWTITAIIPVVIGAMIWSYTTHERLAQLETSTTALRDSTHKLEGSVAALRDAAELRGKQIDKLESSITSLRDATQAQGRQIEAQGKQIEELARVVSAKPPIDPSSIKELIDQGKRMREDLRQIKDAVSKSGAPSQPR